jgi:putative RecB family exonuclease
MHFSYTQLDTFLNCKLKYKLKYIQKVRVDVPTSIELFLGDCIHKVLKELYTVVQQSQSKSQPGFLVHSSLSNNTRFSEKKQSIFSEVPTKEKLVSHFSQLWKSTFIPTILVPKATPDWYFQRGVVMLEKYYDSFFPFTQEQIIGLETSDSYQLPLGDTYAIRIDKLASKCVDSQTEFYVYDYKTSAVAPAHIDSHVQKQLAMYALWVKSMYGDQSVVHLTWIYIQEAKILSYTLTTQQLLDIQQSILTIIQSIKSEKTFEPTVGRLCDWCVYKSVCPAWSGQLSLQQFTGTK